LLAAVVTATTSATPTSTSSTASAGSLIFGLFIGSCICSFSLVLLFAFFLLSNLVLKFFNLLEKFALSVFLVPCVLGANFGNLLVKIFCVHWWRDLDQTKLLNQDNVKVENILILNFLLLFTLVLFATPDCGKLRLLSLLFTAEIEQFTIC
jgi:hypothetical protein